MICGVIVSLKKFREDFAKAKSYGISSCQLVAWVDSDELTPDLAEEVKACAKENGVEISALWRGWRGPTKWNFTEGNSTLGIVPVEYRADRIYDLKRGVDFAKMLGITDVVTHMGFIPECPNTDEYRGVVEAVSEVAHYAKDNGINVLFETGQETPITLLRIITDVGTGNLYVNLDPANLIMYGKANPVDALDVFGHLVRGVHGKDGVYPTDPRFLGKEVKIGDGKARFEELLPKLHACGYDGAITIEREISGDEQVKDILHAKALLEGIFANLT